MLSGLTLPEDNLDHKGEKPRGDCHLEGKGGLLAQKNHQLDPENKVLPALQRGTAGRNQDGKVLPCHRTSSNAHHPASL